MGTNRPETYSGERGNEHGGGDELDRKTTYWVAHLVDLDAKTPDGLGSELPTILDRGYVDARHRSGIKDPHDVQPGEEYNASIRFMPQDTIVPAGHRIGLIIDSNDNWTDQSTTLATSVIKLGGPGGSRLILPAVEAVAPAR